MTISAVKNIRELADIPSLSNIMLKRLSSRVEFSQSIFDLDFFVLKIMKLLRYQISKPFSIIESYLPLLLQFPCSKEITLLPATPLRCLHHLLIGSTRTSQHRTGVLTVLSNWRAFFCKPELLSSTSLSSNGESWNSFYFSGLPTLTDFFLINGIRLPLVQAVGTSRK